MGELLAGVKSRAGHALAGLPARADHVAAAARDVLAEVSAERRAVDRRRDAGQASASLADRCRAADVSAGAAVLLVTVLGRAETAAAREPDALAVVEAGVTLTAVAAGTRGAARGRSTGARG